MKNEILKVVRNEIDYIEIKFDVITQEEITYAESLGLDIFIDGDDMVWISLR